MEPTTHQHSEYQRPKFTTTVDRCPWCNSEISHEEFLRIKEEIRAEEEAKLEQQRESLERDLKESTDAVRREAEGKLAQARAEHDEQLARTLHESLSREATLREELRHAAEERTKEALDEQREQLAKRFEANAAESQLAHSRALKQQAEEISRLKSEATTKADEDRRLKEELEKQMAALVLEKEEAAQKIAALKEREGEVREKAKAEEREAFTELLSNQADQLLKAQEAATAAQGQLQQAREEQQAAIEDARLKVLEEAKIAKQAELLEQRKVLEKDRDDQLMKQRAEQSRKNERLEQQIKKLEQQIQEKSVDELGEGGEINLFQRLCDEYPEDRITPMNQGERGGIRFEVLDHGEVVGKIIIESKNCQQWRDSYVEKLRADQLQEKADHAILSSTVFPSKQRQLCLVERSVVVSPKQVVFIVQLLRESILQVNRLRLSNTERESKVEDLYKFIISPRFEQLFERATEVTKKLDDIDAKEKTAHDKVWKSRGSLIQSLRRNLRDVDHEIQAIIQGAS